MKTSAVVAIVVAILIVVGGWYVYATYTPDRVPSTNTSTNTNANSPDYYPNGTPGSTTNITNAEVSAAAPLSVSVTLTAEGFSPKTVTIKKGGTVTFTNESTGKMWVASGQHPTHTVYSGTTLSEHCDDATDTSFDQCKNSNTYSFVFDKVGSWNYHNHSVAGQFGSIVVVE